jgi:hypothetical protein
MKKAKISKVNVKYNDALEIEITSLSLRKKIYTVLAEGGEILFFAKRPPRPQNLGLTVPIVQPDVLCPCKTP